MDNTNCPIVVFCPIEVLCPLCETQCSFTTIGKKMSRLSGEHRTQSNNFDLYVMNFKDMGRLTRIFGI